MNLNARLLGFSVDPDFGDALDGLMLADLIRVPRPMLSRVMGCEAADRFLEYHRWVDARADSRLPAVSSTPGAFYAWNRVK